MNVRMSYLSEKSLLNLDFTKIKDLYYYPFKDASLSLKWNIPTRKRRIILSHDESTFRSGELPMYRWIIESVAPFYNKGKGRSIMLSMFIVQHQSCLFELDESEWKKAIEENNY